MDTGRLNDIIAHFIGLYDVLIEEMRLRTRYTEGHGPREPMQDATDDGERAPAFNSDLLLKDYEPGVNYMGVNYGIGPIRGGDIDQVFANSIHKLAAIANRDVSAPHFGTVADEQMAIETKLVVFAGPGSDIGHGLQVNVLQDDDRFTMTDDPAFMRDTTFVYEQLAQFNASALAYSPFATLDRTDAPGALEQIADQFHAYSQNLQQTGTAAFGTGTSVDFVLAGSSIDGIYVNGQLVSDVPKLDDFMPDRGLAATDEASATGATTLSLGDTGNSLTVTAGSNLVANVLSLTDTSVISPVMAVMGDYRQVDSITQVFVYSDRDTIDDVLASADGSGQGSLTIAKNIAVFERSTYESGNRPETHDADGAPIFPTAWRVSVVEGDVSFVHWMEQYHFISDNDTMTVTSIGADATVLTGGNTSVNLASFLGVGMQYDLMLVGGSVYDINSITQISLLYDNDWVKGAAVSDMSGATSMQTSGNVIWNLASIHNVGAMDRFQAMPDYMRDTADAINDRYNAMPEGLSQDANFAGYQGLNVLYISGNLYDVNVIKQVSVLGDSDHVTQAAAKVLAGNDNATVSIDTGSNAVVNIAQITDYDSFGHTTYLAGQLYSDAILIQGGLVEHDATQPMEIGQKLANEVIAFLSDDPSGSDQLSVDGIINAGHDLSFSAAHPVDVMQTAVA